VFGYAATKIDFEIIDFVKLILVKNELNVMWFMFGYSRIKVSKINSIGKITFGSPYFENKHTLNHLVLILLS